jgi:short-subunit dehydrogenase
MSLEEQVALITGAASGIGRELARQFSGLGMLIAAVDINDAGLKSLETELNQNGRRVESEIADVTSPDAMRAAVASVENRLGPVYLAIPCAGVGRETRGTRLQASDVASIVEVNLIGVSNTVAAVLPGMLQRRRGHIVGISSLASLRGLPRMLGYCASKAGLNAFLEGLRVELRPYNIAVTTVCPGWVRTPMTENLAGRMRLMEVSVAAREIVKAVQSRRRFHAFPRGTAWTLRLVRLLPPAVSDRIIERMINKLG